ncbi:FAD-binding oxidoreductase [Mumia zhuanghuii]|uniref:Delta(24)-sterol reductase n=1 Tax=Mumia zhuanghuii TaxID=2585211 RepID=A0A5Q6S4E7_9ACTN|nr:FAD-binding oxidoreductase [Mumia zhuanghuii]
MSDLVGHDLVGHTDHDGAVRRLRASYDAIPDGAPVRLAKRTTNLFRPRDATDAPGLDVSGLTGVISVDIDPETGEATADVQGMCTYEDLVAVTLARGYIPYVVPQLRTITLGGAVTGLGIEATSFRNGLPHESVVEMDVFTGAGEVVTCSRDVESRLFFAFPNSYGTLGYSTRIRILLEKAPGWVRLRHVRFDDADAAAAAIARIVTDRSDAGVRVDAIDGTAFSPGEIYLTLAEFTATDPAADGEDVSDYTGQQIYYRSVRERTTDVLTMADYLWRWDTDWFWCSGAFGAQNPLIRRVWPRKYRRSDVYQRFVGLDTKYALARRLDRIKRNGIAQRERVIQDIEVSVDRLAEFLRWFDDEVGMRPVWLCPLRLREPDGPGSATHWPLYPLEPATTYVNVGFWGTVAVPADAPPGMVNRRVETEVHALGGHKSLYSEAFYDADTFAELYNLPHLAEVKAMYDPKDRLTGLYEKAVKRR